MRDWYTSKTITIEFDWNNRIGTGRVLQTDTTIIHIIPDL